MTTLGGAAAVPASIGRGNSAKFQLYYLQKGKCYLCGKGMPLPWDTAKNRRVSRDHVHPRGKGGQLNDDNMLLAHQECNNLKGNRLPTEEQKAMAADLAQIKARMFDQWSRKKSLQVLVPLILEIYERNNAE